MVTHGEHVTHGGSWILLKTTSFGLSREQYIHIYIYILCPIAFPLPSFTQIKFIQSFTQIKVIPIGTPYEKVKDSTEHRGAHLLHWNPHHRALLHWTFDHSLGASVVVPLPQNNQWNGIWKQWAVPIFLMYGGWSQFLFMECSWNGISSQKISAFYTILSLVHV